MISLVLFNSFRHIFGLKNKSKTLIFLFIFIGINISLFISILKSFSTPLSSLTPPKTKVNKCIIENNKYLCKQVYNNDGAYNSYSNCLNDNECQEGYPLDDDSSKDFNNVYNDILTANRRTTNNDGILKFPCPFGTLPYFSLVDNKHYYSCCDINNFTIPDYGPNSDIASNPNIVPTPDIKFCSKQKELKKSKNNNVKQTKCLNSKLWNGKYKNQFC
jgi:hypothetical protein